MVAMGRVFSAPTGQSRYPGVGGEERHRVTPAPRISSVSSAAGSAGSDWQQQFRRHPSERRRSIRLPACTEVPGLSQGIAYPNWQGGPL